MMLAFIIPPTTQNTLACQSKGRTIQEKSSLSQPNSLRICLIVPSQQASSQSSPTYSFTPQRALSPLKVSPNKSSSSPRHPLVESVACSIAPT